METGIDNEFSILDEKEKWWLLQHQQTYWSHHGSCLHLPQLHHNFLNLITVFSHPFPSRWHTTSTCPDIFQGEKHQSFVQQFLKWLQSSIFQAENNIIPLLSQSLSSDQKQVTGLSLSIQGRRAFSWINYFLLPNILWSLQSKFETSIHFNLLLSSFVLKGYLDLSLLVIFTKVNKNSFSLSKTNCSSILTTA